MNPVKTPLALLALLLLLVQQVAGCNAVLGIEPAELDQQVSCQQEVIISSSECAPSDSCEECLGTCTDGEIAGCHADSECRKGLVAYHRCLPDDCAGSKSCSSCLQRSPRGEGCLARCADACRGSETYSLCNVYCSCMMRNCASSPEVANCVATCPSKLQWRLPCLISHCELAPKDPTIPHCAHATDTDSQCPGTPDVLDPNCTKTRAGEACTTDAECCSGFCLPHHACAP